LTLYLSGIIKVLINRFSNTTSNENRYKSFEVSAGTYYVITSALDNDSVYSV